MQQLNFEKEFDAPVEELYRAWTQPEALKQWWQPMGNQLADVTNELKEGGTVSYRFNPGNGGADIDISGTYEKVAPNEELVYGWNWHFPDDAFGDGNYRLTIGFESSGAGSRLKVLQENLGEEEAVQPHEEGWAKALENLKGYLSGK